MMPSKGRHSTHAREIQLAVDGAEELAHMSDSTMPGSGELSQFNAARRPRIIGLKDGPAVDLIALTVRFMVRAEESGGGFSLAEHPIPPRTLAAPLHRHSHEDECNY